MLCALIEEVAVKPCNTQDVFYSHDSPYYSPYRGGCVCYSGDFICAKEDFTRGFKPDQTPTGSVCLLRMAWLHIPVADISLGLRLRPCFSPATTGGSLAVPGLQP